jgi:eukaryotic-like serine/threonine-protein kinase
MSAPDRWQRVEALYHGARERDVHERAAFLDLACEDDVALRREVESLLAQSASTGGFLSEPVMAAAAPLITNPAATVLIGRRIGAYHVQALLGAGGMGEVYRARDTKLGREVAIKFLPRVFASDSDRLARFEREARMLAALNHPNIGAVYGVEEAEGLRAIVLELVEGDTLADRLQRGPVPVGEALNLARQIVEALDAAHEKGIIHRDLKPANIKITPDGVVKVLDFGLAKVASTDGSIRDLTQSPTVTVGGTHDGVILGTAAYMSPEQARGQAVDKRADIWAFGCVLYEMLTGRIAFAGQTVSDTIAAILEREPDWMALPADVSPTVRRLLMRCLQKGNKLRLHDIADARIELDDLPSDATHTAPVTRPALLRRLGPWVAGAVAGSVITGVVMLAVRNVPKKDGFVRFTVSLPLTDQFTVDYGLPVPVAISPDSDRIVFAIRRDGVERLYSRRLDELEAREIPGTEGGVGPFFSPDGQWLGFYAERSLKKLALAGGTPVTICAAVNVTGASWSVTGQIIYSAWLSPLMAVSADGGTPEPVMRLNKSEDEGQQNFPHVLPDGKAALFATRGRVEVVDLSTKERRVVAEGNNPSYVNTGHLVFARGQTIFAAPFDLTRRTTTGPPVQLLDGVRAGPGRTNFAVAPTGSLVYLPTPVEVVGTLAWGDREGRWRPVTGDRRNFWHPRLSPDGSRIAVGVRREAGQEEIWLYDVRRGTGSRLLDAPATRAVWTPDGTRLTFQRGGRLYTVSAGGKDEPKLTLEDAGSILFPLGWSKASGVLSYSRVRADSNRNVWMLLPTGQTAPFLNTVLDERSATLSPDGRWVVYAIREQGAPEQVYVQPSSGSGERVMVSNDGGMQPVWSPTGLEIFYRSLDGIRLLTVDVKTVPNLRLGMPKVAIETRFMPMSEGFFSDYDVSLDGREFLMLKMDDVAAAPKLHVVVKAFN